MSKTTEYILDMKEKEFLDTQLEQDLEKAANDWESLTYELLEKEGEEDYYDF